MNHTIESTRSLNHPEDLERKDLEAASRLALLAEAEKDLVERWADDNLPLACFDAPIKRFLDDDSGLLQQLVTDYLSGDDEELAHTAGSLARSLIKHIKSTARI